MGDKDSRGILAKLLHRLLVVTGAAALTIAFFLLMPLIQAISPRPESDVIVRDMETGKLPPPDPPPLDEEPPKEEEPEPEPPKLEEDSQLLDLSQLELALNPGAGGGWLEGGINFDLGDRFAGGVTADTMFGMDDLEQPPRPIHRPQPTLDNRMLKKRPGAVVIIFVVNEQGRVEQVKAESSSDPIFERPAIAAVKQWRFEPGKRNGKPASFNMRCPLTF